MEESLARFRRAFELTFFLVIQRCLQLKRGEKGAM